MKKMAFVLALSASCTLYAAGDYQAGQEKSTLCTACHGPAGVSVMPEWPSLAGQHANYMKKQLHDYQEGKHRQAGIMASIVAQLSEQDISDLATYYAKQPVPEGTTSQKYLKRGEQLYRGGDFDKHITACIACHGPTGRGNAQAGFPVIAGQQIGYTVQQLQAFKDKARSNDLNAIMRDISSRMDKDDMTAVANYLHGLYKK